MVLGPRKSRPPRRFELHVYVYRVPEESIFNHFVHATLYVLNDHRLCTFRVQSSIIRVSQWLIFFNCNLPQMEPKNGCQQSLAKYHIIAVPQRNPANPQNKSATPFPSLPIVAMASSFPSILHIFLLLSLACMAAQANVVDDTCGSYDPDPSAGAVTPNYCRECLNKTPGGASTRKNVATTLLDCSVASAADARNKAFALSAKDSQKMPKCAQAFAQAHQALSGAVLAVKRDDFAGAKTGTVVCNDGYHVCANAFGTKGLVPEPVNSLMSKLKDLCNASYGVLVSN